MVLLYTIMPYNSIFGQNFDMQTETKKIDGGYLELVKDADGYTISRLISTDPRMYLKPGFAPGTRYIPNIPSAKG